MDCSLLLCVCVLCTHSQGCMGGREGKRRVTREERENGIGEGGGEREGGREGGGEREREREREIGNQSQIGGMKKGERKMR